MFKRIAILVSLILLNACSGSYNFQVFTFPSGSSIDEGKWEYIGEIIVHNKYGKSPTDPVEKKLDIIIENKEGKSLLKDNITIIGGIFNYKIAWEDHDQINIKIYGETPKSSGPIMELNYTYEVDRYVRKNT